GGLNTKFQLYTVPGQVYYNSTRKLVLQGVDGVVFVADSRESKLSDNIESLQNLIENLSEYGVQVTKDVPLVIQWNKRDMPEAASPEFLEKNINTLGVPTTEAVAALGKGVIETLKLIASLVLENLNKRQNQTSNLGNPESAKREKTAAEPEKILATIDEVRINELYLKNYYRVQSRVSGSGVPKDFDSLSKDEKSVFLNMLIDHYLMVQESKKRGIAAPKGEIDLHMETYEKKFGSPEKYADYLARRKLKKEDVRNEIAKKIITNRMIRALIPDCLVKVQIADGELTTYYQNHQDQFQGEFQDVKEKVALQLKRQKQGALKKQVADTLRKKCRLTIEEDNL
ncbi:MAG: SurA N-terminal domain-containing protein, partial [Nitrospinota bacterium]